MTKKLKTLGLLLIMMAGYIVSGQTTDKGKALMKGREAIKLMDNGKIEEGVRLLEEAQKLDAGRFDYPYELAYAKYLKEDYNGAIKILEKIINHKDVTEQLFQLLGSSYDMLAQPAKALKFYDAGLKKFPNSGIIYLEKGNIYWNKEEYEKALSFYEKGIEVDPKFPSNYYRAAKIYLSTKEEVWGMIYGEIFMNLETSSKRTTEISKLIFDTYKSKIKFTSDASKTVSFCQQMTVNVNSLSASKDFRRPFCMIYEPTLLLSIVTEKSIDINSLHRIRKGFVENYFKKGYNKTYPNVLFAYQDKILKAGHLEAYNHWLLMNGDEDAFLKWQSKNMLGWDNFVKWFTENGLKLSQSNKFYRSQY